MVKKKKLNLNELELEAESWRIMVRASQKYYPRKKRKAILEKEMYGIRLAVLRLGPNKMLKNYNAKFLPLLGKDDPLALKLVRNNYVQDIFLDKVHLSVRASLRNLTRGRLGVLFPEGRSYVNLISNSCPRCLEQNEWAYE